LTTIASVSASASAPASVGWLDHDRAGGSVASTPRSVTPAAPAASNASARGLDWFVFFLADIQAGFGPFIAIYLTERAWSQADIGLILTIGALAALGAQMPAGALIDVVRARRFTGALAVTAIGASAIALALWPVFAIVAGARILHGVASALLGPVIAAMSLGLAGHASLGERLGRNARFASIGALLAAAGMGATGQLATTQAVFLLTALLVAPALLALWQIRSADIDRSWEREEHRKDAPDAQVGLRDLLRNNALLIFAGCIVLFHLANAAMLPAMAGQLAPRCGSWTTTVVAACMVVPQLMVALFSPWVGRQAQIWGRRPLLLAGFAALTARAVLFALVQDPYAVIAIQALDGVSGAILGLMFPLIIADLTRGTGRFNLALGIVGSAMGIGAALSTTLAGYMIDAYGCAATFFGLAAVAAAGLALVYLLMPETRPQE
jgi:MFS family permease